MNRQTEKLYNSEEFAKLLGVSVRTLYNWEKQGSLIPFRKAPANRIKFYTHEQYIEYMKSCGVDMQGGPQ